MLEVTDSKDCMLATGMVTVTIPTVTVWILPQSDFRLWPNPVSTEMFLSTSGVSSAKLFGVLYDNRGGVIREYTPADLAQIGNRSLNVRDLPPGLYYLHLRYPQGHKALAFVKM